jgi:glyoxylase-like metal-dependent hydrolase (beta-lactamase superfamily II)
LVPVSVIGPEFDARTRTTLSDSRSTRASILAAVASLRRDRELGRADRILPGVWRLRLPLPWPGVPHVNAWALRAGDGIVLVDTGIHEPGAFDELQRTIHQTGHSLADVKLLVCTHAHTDHYGLAAAIVEAAGCQLWMHPRHEHMTRAVANPERSLERRIEVARQSGVPVEPLERWAAERRDSNVGIAGVVLPDVELVPGVELETDLGRWSVHETPGHAPSHICLFQPDNRLLVSGDHLLGRVSLYFDYGWTPDPVAEFLGSLDEVEQLDARLCLPGHGRPFTDVRAHIEANRAEVNDRIESIAAALAERGELTAYELVPIVLGEEFARMMSWALTIVLCYLTQLEATGRAERVSLPDGSEPERWKATAATAVRP